MWRIKWIGLALIAAAQSAQAQISWQPNFNLAPAILQAQVLNPCPDGKCNARGKSPSPRQKAQPRFLGPPIKKTADSLALRFSVALPIRKALIDQTISNAEAQDPVLAADVRRAFATEDPVIMTSRKMGPVGLAPNNIADALTYFLVRSWAMTRGLPGLPSKEQVQGVRRQASESLLTSQQLGKVTNVQKQQFAETLLIQTSLLEANFRGLRLKPREFDQFSAGLAQLVRGMGVDLRNVTITGNGFAPSRPGQ